MFPVTFVFLLHLSVSEEEKATKKAVFIYLFLQPLILKRAELGRLDLP
jgi:hypothetical protein